MTEDTHVRTLPHYTIDTIKFTEVPSYDDGIYILIKGQNVYKDCYVQYKITKL